MKKNVLSLRSSSFVLLIASICLTYCSKDKDGDDGNTGGTNTTVNAEITILAADIKQTIAGFGCATVFAPPNTSPYTSEDFDRLFGGGDGQIGLNMLRIRVATDAAWRAVELNHALWARQRGAAIIATPWSPPANMKTNNSLIGGSLKPDSAAAYAKYLNDFVNYMNGNGVIMTAISVQNEPDITVNYESCEWTAESMKNFIKSYGHLITNASLLAPESFNNNHTYINTILNDPVAADKLRFVGAHIYGGGVVENTVAKSLNKDVWMTEHLDTNTSYSANLNTAVEIHDCLTKANFSAYFWWYGKRFYGLIGQDGAVTKRGFIMSHFSRFHVTGTKRIGTSANTRSDVLVSAFQNYTVEKIIAINTGPNFVNQKFTFQDATVNGVLPFLTTNIKNLDRGEIIPVTNNSFTCMLPPYSITTFLER